MRADLCSSPEQSHGAGPGEVGGVPSKVKDGAKPLPERLVQTVTAS